MPAMPVLGRDQRFIEMVQDAMKEVADQTQVQFKEVSLQFREVSDCMEDHVHQLNEIFRSLSNEVLSLKSTNTSLKTRLSSLELLVEQQQDQISQLSSAGNNLTREVTAVRLDHRGLKDEHRALCDCLEGKELLSPMEVRARSRWHHGLGMLREVLDDKQVMLRMWRMAGKAAGCLLLASSAFRSQRADLLGLRTQRGPLPGGSTGLGEAEVERLLRAARNPSERVWKKMAEYEPSARSLETWACSAVVQKAFGSFVIESMPGSCEEMRFADVHKLLAEVGISREQLVRTFLYASPLPWSLSSGHNLQPVADEILERFASKHTEGDKKRLRFRDLYRLLEVIGMKLERFEKQFGHFAEPELTGGRSLYFGRHRVLRSIGGGCQGVCFLAEEPKERAKVAIKWPVKMEEVSTLRQLQQRPLPCLGMPRLLGTGEYQEQTYVVTQAFGSPLLKVFLCLEGRSAEQRWRAMSVLGRLMVRRLQSLHTAGFVHCDISPENILLGPPPASAGAAGARFAPFLVDFGHAQKFPGGPGLVAGHAGSLEWSSIRSAECGDPLPEDDLQALGWVLLHGVFGELPWFKSLQRAYREESRFICDQMVMQVQQAKIQLLKDGWQSFGLKRAKVPAELVKFIQVCFPAPSNGRVSGAQGSNCRRELPNYAALVRLLGGDPGLGAEEQDLRLFSEQLMPFL